MVDFSDSPEQARWRAEVEEFLDANLPQRFADVAKYGGSLGGMSRAPRTEADGASDAPRGRASRQWRKAILDQGWIAPAWPKEYGGADMTPMEQYILREVFAERRAPLMGVPDVGSTVLVHGSDEQKAEYLPQMVRGEVQWCQGYSEPGAGSDLASLQTRATHDGDDFVINGQKIWTSGAMTAEMIFAMVRTDPDAPKHRGITYLLFPMDLPGITVRQIDQMTGARAFAEVFFEDVRVPRKNAVGEINRGWYVGATHLDFERSSIGSAVGFHNRMADLTDYLVEEAAQDTGRTNLRRSATTRLRIADGWIESAVARNFSNRIITLQNRGLIPNYEASVQKLFSSELHQRIANTAIQALGQYGMLYDPEDSRTPMRAVWGTYYLATVSETIGAGTSEIQRNVIATRGLGLPRG